VLVAAVDQEQDMRRAMFVMVAAVDQVELIHTDFLKPVILQLP
jgi:hypothetical protein